MVVSIQVGFIIPSHSSVIYTRDNSEAAPHPTFDKNTCNRRPAPIIRLGIALHFSHHQTGRRMDSQHLEIEAVVRAGRGGKHVWCGKGAVIGLAIVTLPSRKRRLRPRRCDLVDRITAVGLPTPPNLQD